MYRKDWPLNISMNLYFLVINMLYRKHGHFSTQIPFFKLFI